MRGGGWVTQVLQQNSSSVNRRLAWSYQEEGESLHLRVSLAATTVELARPRSLGWREMFRCPVLTVTKSSTTSVLWYYHEAGMASLKHSMVMTRTWLLEGEGSRSQ